MQKHVKLDLNSFDYALCYMGICISSYTLFRSGKLENRKWAIVHSKEIEEKAKSSFSIISLCVLTGVSISMCQRNV